MSSRPLRQDIEARESLELLDRAARTHDQALALEAAQRIARLRPRYALRDIGPPPEPPRLIRSRYVSTCCECSALIGVDAPIVYDRNSRSVTCGRCVEKAQ